MTSTASQPANLPANTAPHLDHVRPDKRPYPGTPPSEKGTASTYNNKQAILKSGKQVIGPGCFSICPRHRHSQHGRTNCPLPSCPPPSPPPHPYPTLLALSISLARDFHSDDEDDTYEDDQDRQSVMSHDTARDESLQPPAKTRKKPGRKPNPASPAVRKEQNRAAQRAFRDRKERHLQQLEGMLKELKETHFEATERSQHEAHQLKTIIESLQSENYYLREVVFSFESALGKTGNSTILQDVKAELYRRHYENHAARKLSLSGPAQQQQQQQQQQQPQQVHQQRQQQQQQHPSPAMSSLGPDSPMSVSVSATTPSLTSRPIPGPVPVDDSIPHATQVQMLNQALAAAFSAHIATHSQTPNAMDNVATKNNLNANNNANKAPFSTTQLPLNMNMNNNTLSNVGSSVSGSSSSSNSTPNAWTQLGLDDPQDDNIFSMNSEILYKAPALFPTAGADNNRLNSPLSQFEPVIPSHTAFGSASAPWPQKQSPSSALDDLQASLFSQSTGNDASLFGQLPDQRTMTEPTFSPNQNMFSFSAGSMDSAFPAQTPNFLDSDDVDSNEFSMSTPNPTFDDGNLKQKVIPTYRLQTEIRALASATPATDPSIDPQIYALPHDSRIDLIPCPKLRVR